MTQREATLASDLLTQAHQLIRASYLHEYTQSTAAAAGAASAASDSSASAVSATDRLQLVTGGVLRQTGSYSVVAMRLGEILLQTLPEGQQIRLTNECAFDLSLGLPDDFKPPSTPALDRFGAYCEWIANKSKLLQLPVWEMKPLASVHAHSNHREDRSPHSARPFCSDALAHCAPIVSPLVFFFCLRLTLRRVLAARVRRCVLHWASAPRDRTSVM